MVGGSDAGMFLDTPTRTKVDLSGTWNYSLDGKTWNPVKIPSAYDFVEKVTYYQAGFCCKDSLFLEKDPCVVAFGLAPFDVC